MATVFFKINDQQEREVSELMEGEGYTNKAEFFRFLIKFYKYKKTPDENRLEKATQDLASVLKKLDEKGMIGGPIEDQLSYV